MTRDRRHLAEMAETKPNLSKTFRLRSPRILRSTVLVFAACAVLGISTGGVAAAFDLDDLVEAHTARAPEHVPLLAHVVVVVFENKEIGEVEGSSDAPVFNRLSRLGADIPNYNGITHPSLPNYLALVSGSTHGVSSDCTSCSVTGPSLGTTLRPATWKTYAEGLPSPGWLGPSMGEYAKKHNPFVYFRSLGKNPSLLRRSILPLGAFRRDLRHRALPRFALVVPDLCHDMHDCNVSIGDRWLGSFLSPLLRSPNFKRGVVFVVFDEGYPANHVPALAVGPAVRTGSVFSRPTNHYGLLRTIEQALDLPLLGRSRDAQSIGGIWR